MTLVCIKYEHRLNGDVPVYVMAVMTPRYAPLGLICRRVNAFRDVIGRMPIREEAVVRALDALVERRLAKVDDMGRYALGDVLKAKARIDARRKWGEACEEDEVRKGIVKVRPAIREVSP